MYQSTTATPWAYLQTPARTGAWGDYFRGMSLVAWLFLLIVSFWWLRDWRDIYALRESGVDKNLQYVACGIALLAHLTLGFGTIIEQTIRFFASVKGRCLGGFCLLMLALAPMSLTPLRSALYALATLGVMLLCSWMWQVDYDRFRRVMLIAAGVLFGFLILLAVHHGLSKTSVGGIARNRFGQAAFTAAVCLFVTRGRIKWVGFALCMALALMVNSRGTMLACGAFATVYLGLKFGMSRGILLMMLFPLAAVFLLAIPKIGQRVENVLINDVAKLNDKGRGIGSGFSSRLDTWREGMAVFARSPAVGHGFRTRVGGGTGDDYFAHSGYVNLLADAGLAGAALVFGAFVYDFFKRFGAIKQVRRQFSNHALPAAIVDTFELNCVICAFLVAESALWLFEPLYLNLGASLSILFILLITAPYSVGRGSMPAPYGYAMSPYQLPTRSWG